MLNTWYILSFLIGLLSILIAAYIRIQNSAKRKNIPELNSTFPWGHLSNAWTNPTHIIFDMDKYYKLMKTHGYKFANFNLMLANTFFLIHPDTIKEIMTKKFDHFVDRSLYYNEKDDPLSANLGSIQGDRWRKERSQLSPVFTPSKLKILTEHILHCCNTLEKVLVRNCESKIPVDLKDMSMRLTTDVIGRCAFGIECNSLSDPDDLFRKYSQDMVIPEFKIDFKIIFCTTFPNLARKLGIKTVPDDVTELFFKRVIHAIRERETNGIQRSDLLHLMTNLKDENDENVFTMNQIAGHAFVYFTAGFETSALALTFCLYELSKNQDIQDKARREIKEVLAKNDNVVNFEMLGDLKYLQQVINESLRLRPPIPLVSRNCSKDYIVADTNILLKKSTNVALSLYSIHHDPEYFPDPEKFDPERFSEENKSKIRPQTFLPFGEGPRNCIGIRFAYTELKISLVTILRRFKVIINKNTPEKIEIHPKAILLMNKDKLYVDLEKIEE